VVDVRNIGLVGAIELASAEGAPGTRGYDVLNRAFADGLLTRVTGDTIALSPPLIVERSHIDELVDKLENALAASSKEFA
jgi:beta-alanine--pyruvate transaminase